MIAFVSDIHGHLAALDSVLADARRRGASRFVCLGDVESDACLERLASVGALCVFGNWEVSGWLHCAEPQRSWVQGWPPVWSEDGWMAAHASPDWPAQVKTLEATAAYRQQRSLHWLSLFPPLDRDGQARWRALATLESAGARVAFHGHTHVQEAWRWLPNGRLYRIPAGGFDVALDGSRYLVGVGSVGSPRDGSGACYALWNPPRRVSLIRVKSEA
jgi:hypothetical protein